METKELVTEIQGVAEATKVTNDYLFEVQGMLYEVNENLKSPVDSGNPIGSVGSRLKDIEQHVSDSYEVGTQILEKIEETNEILGQMNGRIYTLGSVAVFLLIVMTFVR